MKAYYNEIDEYAAQWLRNLIAAGHITPGDVDTRSIEDVTPDDLKGYTRAHFFAGIGVWDYALNRAGWPTNRPVWTMSCPCQPFSVAGKGDGFSDERHLWPAAFHHIEIGRPVTVFGEQVASKDGYAWLDLVQADLEGTGYTVGSLVAPAAGFGAPHQRHRMYWVADSEHDGPPSTARSGHILRMEQQERRADGAGSVCESSSSRGPVRGLADADEHGQRTGGRAGLHSQGEPRPFVAQCGEPGGLADTADFGQHGRRSSETGNGGTPRFELERLRDVGGSGLEKQFSERGTPRETGGGTSGQTIKRASTPVGGLADAEGAGGWPDARAIRSGSPSRLREAERQDERRACVEAGWTGDSSATNGFWSAAEWIYCRDEKYRPVEPGTFPLAHGATSRVGRLRAYGNAICAPQAEEFIKAYLGTRP